MEWTPSFIMINVLKVSLSTVLEW